ncbi:MAG: hypothetical protein K8S27_07010 [Candidatus Omnitrophica bacterium]|nr:hypothetical protein [Candidatus Omnitrophota bacterium]
MKWNIVLCCLVMLSNFSLTAHAQLKNGVYDSLYENGLFRFTLPAELKGYKHQPQLDGVRYFNRKYQIDLVIRCQGLQVNTDRVFAALENESYKAAFVEGFNKLAEHKINRTRFRQFQNISIFELTAIDPEKKHLPYTVLIFNIKDKEFTVSLSAPEAAFFEGEESLITEVIKNIEVK